MPDTSFTNTTNQTQANERTRNRINTIYDWNIDSSSSLKVTIKASDTKSSGLSNYLGQSISSDNKIINESDRTTNSIDDKKELNSSIFWRKKLKKKGRTISLNMDFNLNDREENGFLLAKNSFYDKTGLLIKLDNVDQRKVNKQNGSTINATASYTEPLWKNTFLILNYKLSVNTNDAERNTYNKSNNGKYDVLSDSLSNHFIFNTIGHTGGFNIRYNVKKFNFAVGTGLGTVNYRLNDVRKGNNRDVRFNNFLPAVSLNYTPKQQRRFSINYNGTTQNPTLNQIQPLIDNIDPLNLTVGNPNLKQAFVHNLSVRGSDYKVLKSRSIFFNLGYTTTEQAISNNSFVDSFGRRINQAINVDGNFTLRGSLGYGFDIIPSLNLNIDAGPRINRYVNYVNGKRNETRNTATNISVNMGYWADKWINFWMNFDANYNHSVSSIRPDVATNYWSYNYNSNLEFRFKKQKFYWSWNADFNLYQKTADFAGVNNVYLVNTTLRKVIGKDDKWETRLYVNDIFNQNLGINRNISSNFITETTNQNIQRYFMLSLVYNFSKNGKPSSMGF